MAVLIIIREILTIISIIAGMIIAFPFIKKKILEEKLKTKIDELDTLNKSNIPLVYKLLEKYSFKETVNYPISRKELSNVYVDILKLKKKLFLSQGEIATLVINLEEFFRRVIHWYKNYGGIRLSISEIYGILNNVLYDIYYFITKNVPYPQSSFMNKSVFINTTMSPYCSNTSINIYNNFEIGRIHDAASGIYPLFYNHVNEVGNPIFYKALVDIYGKNISYFIIRLLFLHKYYVPILLKYNDPYGFPDQDLVLVGFKVYRSLGHGEKSVNLYYANLDNSIQLSYLSEISNVKEFKDVYLGFDDKLSLEKLMTHNYNSKLEILEVEFNENYLLEYFLDRKYDIENKMREEKKGRF